MFKNVYTYLLLIDILGEDGVSVQREQGVPGPVQEEPGGEGQHLAGGEQGAHPVRQGQDEHHRQERQGEPHQPRPDGRGSGH